mgnify:CR=1 FL=1
MPLDKKKTDFGIVRIHNKVISSIAALAAKEIKGVLRMGGPALRNIADLFGKKGITEGVKIGFRENNEVDITLYIVIEYGSNVPYVSNLVQENVKKRVEELTGLSVNEVEVNVYDVSEAKKQSMADSR